jgi:Cys-tRNA(Pro)/Cys-tRNA(Cys) deacylase
VTRAATPAIAALIAADVPHEVLTYHHDARAESYGDEAVAALAGDHGLVPEQIFKTLIVAGPTGLAVAVLPVPSRWNLAVGAAPTLADSPRRLCAGVQPGPVQRG